MKAIDRSAVETAVAEKTGLPKGELYIYSNQELVKLLKRMARLKKAEHKWTLGGPWWFKALTFPLRMSVRLVWGMVKGACIRLNRWATSEKDDGLEDRVVENILK